MGAGCYYTSDIDNERTFWVDIPYESEEDFEEYKAQYLVDFGGESKQSFEDFSYFAQIDFVDNLFYSIESICNSKKFSSWSFDKESRTIESGL